jgi:hypothetical protein
MRSSTRGPCLVKIPSAQASFKRHAHAQQFGHAWLGKPLDSDTGQKN